MRLEAEFTSEPFHGEGSPPEHAVAARDAAAEAGLDTDFGPFGTLARGDAEELLEAIPSIARAAFGGGATRVTLQLRRADHAEAAEAAEPNADGSTAPHTSGTARGPKQHTGDFPSPTTGSPQGAKPNDDENATTSASGPARDAKRHDHNSATPPASGPARQAKPNDHDSAAPSTSGTAGGAKPNDHDSAAPSTSGTAGGAKRPDGAEAGAVSAAGTHDAGSAPVVELNDALARLIADVERELGAGLGELDRPGKQRAVRLLRERGAFSLRKSVSSVADALGVTRFTVYNYLNREAD